MRDGKTFMGGVVEVVVEKCLEKAVEVVTGDITARAVDAIVNAANERLQGGALMGRSLAGRHYRPLAKN